MRLFTYFRYSCLLSICVWLQPGLIILTKSKNTPNISFLFMSCVFGCKVFATSFKLFMGTTAGIAPIDEVCCGYGKSSQGN